MLPTWIIRRSIFHKINEIAILEKFSEAKISLYTYTHTQKITLFAEQFDHNMIDTYGALYIAAMKTNTNKAV